MAHLCYEGREIVFAIQSTSQLTLVLLLAFSLDANTLYGSPDWAQDWNNVHVLVFNDAHVQPSTLQAAENEAARIFRLAGIRIAWANCSADAKAAQKEHCSLVAGTKQFVLTIIPKGKTSSNLVFGQAFLGEDGRGRYADVFFDRVQAAHDGYGTSVPRLLGSVAAHELGHLLLGFQAHSWTGIMTPVWEVECMHRMNMGNLLFTLDEARRMQSRLGESGTRSNLGNSFVLGAQPRADTPKNYATPTY